MTTEVRGSGYRNSMGDKHAILGRLRSACPKIIRALDRLIVLYAILVTCGLAATILIPGEVTPEDKLTQEVLYAQTAIQAWLWRALFHVVRTLSDELLEHRENAYDFARLSSCARRLSRICLTSFILGVSLSVVASLMAGKAIVLIDVATTLPGFPDGSDWYAAAGSEPPSGYSSILRVNPALPLMSLLFWLFSLPLERATKTQEETIPEESDKQNQGR